MPRFANMQKMWLEGGNIKMTGFYKYQHITFQEPVLEQEWEGHGKQLAGN